MSDYKSLLHCPKNLKECLGWLIRISGKDSKTNNTNSLESLAKAVNAELKVVGVDVSSELTKWIPDLTNEIVDKFVGIENNKFSGKGIAKGGLPYNSDSAQWKNLCKSGSKCCGDSPCPKCPSPGPCPDNGCCEKCPKRLCAKIFLGFIPALYYGLKIVYGRCKSENSSQWPGWQGSKITEAFELLKFLQAWGYDLKTDLNPSLPAKNISSLLESLFNGSSKPLQSLYDFVSQNYFPRSDPSSLVSSLKPSPSTVRSMLLWLYGLRFHKHFSELVENCKSLCAPFGNSYNPDAFCYYIYTCCFLLPVSVISVIQDPYSHVTTFFSTVDSEWKSFSYPEDPFELRERLCEYVRKMFVPLDFLSTLCKRESDDGGWRQCYFGRNCSLSSPPGSSSSNSGCTSCDGHDKYLCSNSHSCSSSSCSSSCPHPLMAFLIDGSSDPKSKPQSSDSKSLFQPPDGYPKMGFKENLSSTGKSGLTLYGILTVFCKSGFYPLSRLVQFGYCVSRRPPETLLELFAFFQKFAGALTSKSDLSSRFAQWIQDEPGRFLGKALKDAVRGLYGPNHNERGGHIAPQSTPASLRSLYDCSGGMRSTCGKYLYPLIGDSYNLHPKDFLGAYLSWVCHRAEKFKTLLEEFKKDFESCSHCKEPSKCEKIVTCPCSQPKFYKYGFAFKSPDDLNCVTHSRHKETSNPACTLKSCADFTSQLDRVLEGSPLQTLLTVIDNFLWSIRLPFIYAFLYIWIIVISYFYYVQFYKLDLLHIDSHLHLPRSFKILPSTLFSDASSKLKDLSYFTL